MISGSRVQPNKLQTFGVVAMIALLLGNPAKSDTLVIAENWSAAISENRIDDWWALHTPDAVIVDLGTTYASPDRIRGWGQYHATKVNGLFTPIEVLRNDPSCLVWLSDYQDTRMTARFVIAKSLVGDRIYRIRIDWDRPGAEARNGCG